MIYRLAKRVTLGWLCDALSAKHNGSTDHAIDGVASVDEAEEASLSFFKNTHTIEDRTGVIISHPDCGYTPAIFSNNPRLDFIKALYILEQKIGFSHDYPAPEIHPTAIIGENVAISNGVKVNENTIIEPNVVLLPGVSVGKNCLIRANATLGSDGFGFERLEDGSPVKFVHLGGVDIGDNVEIGANTCITRGTLGNTIIEDNVKIDNLVHIAHNCHIKEGAFIIACAEVSGGVVVGKNAWIAPNAAISQQVRIGSGALVGLGAVVTKDVEDETIVIGNPAKFLRRTTD